MSITPLDRGSPTFVAGHRGLVGGAVLRHFQDAGFKNLITRTSTELDLRHAEAVEAFFAAERPVTVVMAAAKVGGILANNTYPAEFISDNLRMQVNVLDAAARHGVEKLLFLGSSCIYPKFTPQPIREDSLLTGPLEPTNDAYAIAKISGILQVQALRLSTGCTTSPPCRPTSTALETTFTPRTHTSCQAWSVGSTEAKESAAPDVTVWGSGTPRREFLHVDDLARACLFLLKNYDEPEPVNVGVGGDLSIRELAKLLADIVGFDGALKFDISKPDGSPRKLLDVSKLHKLGWQAEIDLRKGLAQTYAWYKEQLASGSLRAA